MSGIQENLDPFFPLPSEPREKQRAAMDFIFRMVNAGFKDIVVAAPTGIGKTGIGMGACLWAANPNVARALGSNPGGYYLVTQKLLQDQITHDFERFKDPFQNTGITLKSAVEYECPSHDNCHAGHAATTDWFKAYREGTASTPTPDDPEALRPCPSLITQDMGEYVRDPRSCCKYEHHKREFAARPIGVTNYAYWLSERAFVGRFPDKNILVADECHGLEKTILGFVELGVSPRQIEKYAYGVDNDPLETQAEFLEWLEAQYQPSVQANYEATRERATAQPRNRRVQAELHGVENHLARIALCLDGLKNNPENWVYWCEQDKQRGFHYIVKPLDAAPYFQKLMLKGCAVRIYMSAYPGPKNLFCHTLGLDPAKVAWKNLSSTFPVANRPIHMVLVGSMGQKAYNETLPKLLSTTLKILNRHKDQKGLIHCHSYKLGTAIYEHLMDSEHGPRILFPAAAKDRNELFHRHRFSGEPTVLLSPSMTEGFSLDDDLARFQIIAKMPFPYLGDKQVAAKKDRDQDWYTLQTVMTILQACGRIVRSDTDYGDTYILDRDFYRLYNDDNMQFFPKWFEDAFVWHQK